MAYFVSFIAGVAAFSAFGYFPHLTAALALAVFTLLAMRRNYLLIALVVLGAAYAVLREAPEPSALRLRGEAQVQGYFGVNTDSGKWAAVWLMPTTPILPV